MSFLYWGVSHANPLCPCAQISEYLGALGLPFSAPEIPSSDSAVTNAVVAITLMTITDANVTTVNDLFLITYNGNYSIYYFRINRINVLFPYNNIL